MSDGKLYSENNRSRCCCIGSPFWTKISSAAWTIDQVHFMSKSIRVKKFYLKTALFCAIYGFFADFCVCTNLIWIGRKIENLKLKAHTKLSSIKRWRLTSKATSNIQHTCTHKIRKEINLKIYYSFIQMPHKCTSQSNNNHPTTNAPINMPTSPFYFLSHMFHMKWKEPEPQQQQLVVIFISPFDFSTYEVTVSM